MGLWNLLTREIKLTSVELQFNEPLFGRIRLRGDLLWRVATVLGAWAAAIGVMALLFSINQNPPGFGVAVGLAAVFGLGIAAQALFFMKDQVAGAFAFYPDHIYRYRKYTWFVALRREQTTWDYAAIENCRIATGSKTGLPFHAMMFSYGGDSESILVPRKVDLKKLTGLLARNGVQVAATTKIPSRARKPLPVAAPIVAGAAGTLLLVTGLIAFPWAPAPAGIERPDLAQLPNIELPGQFGIPDHAQQPIPNRGVPGGGAVAQGGPAAQGRPSGNSAEATTPLTNAPSVPAFPPDFPGGGVPGPGGVPNRDPAFGMRPPTSSPPGPPIGFNRPQNARPTGSQPATPVDDADRSELVGGSGGFPFEHVSNEGTPIVGVKVRTGTWRGSEHLAKVEPLYEAEEPGGNWQVTIARPGYVVGAVEIHTREFVDGLRLTFHRKRADGRLDPDDAYMSEWFGEPGENPTRLERENQPIIGFYGRGGAVLDALGVVFAGAG